MNAQLQVESSPTSRYLQCTEVSKRIRSQIDRDVFCGRSFDLSKKFLPDGLSYVDRMLFLNQDERRLLSQIQGRTYANMFGLLKRVIGVRTPELNRDRRLDGGRSWEAPVRFTDDERDNQESLRRVEAMLGAVMPQGYAFLPRLNDVASLVRGKSSWGVLALACFVEALAQAHYRKFIEAAPDCSELYKDMLHYHCNEESQHVILDELEWRHIDSCLNASDRERGIDDFIALVSAMAALLREQAEADSSYLLAACGRSLPGTDLEALRYGVLHAYRWQYIASGITALRFVEMLKGITTREQSARIATALRSIAR